MANAAAAARGDGDGAPCAWATPLVLLLWACLAPMGLAAGPHLYDAGELVAAAWTLGASHPPGQPLHALLAHALTWLPLGPIAARVALFSAACVLGAALLGSRLCRELALDLGATPRDANLAGAATALGLLISSPILRQALRPEVYGLALALSLLAALQLLRWARGDGMRHLAGAAFVAGLAGAVHPPHALAVALIALGFAFARPTLLLRRPLRSIASGIAFGLLGLGAYVYLPARAIAGATMWGDARSFNGLWSYVSASAYAQNVLATARRPMLGVILDYTGYLIEHGAAVYWILALSALGLLAGARRALLLGALFASALAMLAACIQPLEPRNPDNVAYLGPCIAFGIATGAAACAVLRATRVNWLGTFGMLLLALWPVSLLRATANVRNDLPALETLAGALVEAPPARALVIATTDYTAATWMMQQAVDGARPDVGVFIAGLATSSWHWKQLAHHASKLGKPFRGMGRDNHERYLLGAIETALMRVPVALEQSHEALPLRLVSGPYEVVQMLSEGTTQQRPPIGTRLDAVIARAAARGPDGDSGAAAAIVREYQRLRALRLFRLGQPAQALLEIERSMWSLPPEQRALLRAAPTQVAGRIPTWVEDPDAFLVTLEDSVRLGAALLAALDQPQPAYALLHAQAERGDPRSLLQLAWLQYSTGDGEAARRSLLDFKQAAPDLEAEAAWLSAALAH